MGSAISIEEYKEEFAEEWDRFVLKTSANGTFLQSRRFLSYHPEGRFQDSSLMIRKGQEIIAVVPACVREEDGKVIFSSHPGSTFGGIIVSPKYLAISKMISIIELLDGWLIENGFQLSVLKQTSECFCRDESSSIEYALQHEGYESYGELSFVVDFSCYDDPVESNFTASRRRDCRYGEKAGCEFVELIENSDIAEFYDILKKSLEKYNAKPVHSLDELLDFKNKRLAEETRFFGVEQNGSLIAGSMVFLFENQAFHTQYLAADPSHLDVFPMNFMDWNLIRIAKEKGFKYFSFGISTEDNGKKLNSSLASFKEGFGGCHSINRTFTKHL